MEMSWTHGPRSRTKILLLRDPLTKVLPNVRFMTYGYNAAFRNLTTKQDIRSISALLLCELVALRKDVEVF